MSRQFDGQPTALIMVLTEFADAGVGVLLMTMPGDADGKGGMSQEELSAIPKVVATQGNSCTVCIQDFQSTEEVSQLSCAHQFHEQCIGPWLTTKRTCPTCRQPHHQQQ